MDTKELAAALLDELLSRLQPATGEVAADGLGWCYPSKKTTFVYAARAADGSPWYEGSKDESGQFIQNPTDASVRGIIKAFYIIRISSEKYGDNWKLRLLLDCGLAGMFSVQSGVSTVAGHNLIQALSSLTAEEVSQPITITPRPSEQDSKVLFLEVTAGSRTLESAWNADEAKVNGYWSSKMVAATEVIAGVLGEGAVQPPGNSQADPQPEPQPQPQSAPQEPPF